MITGPLIWVGKDLANVKYYDDCNLPKLTFFGDQYGNVLVGS